MTWIAGIQPDSDSNYFGVTIRKNNVENKTFWLWNLTWKRIAGGNGVFDWLFTLMKRNKLSQIWLSLALWFFFCCWVSIWAHMRFPSALGSVWRALPAIAVLIKLGWQHREKELMNRGPAHAVELWFFSGLLPFCRLLVVMCHSSSVMKRNDM